MAKRILESPVTTLVAVALVAVFGVHVVQQWSQGVRLDLTEDDLYSLSEGSLEILEKMRQEGVAPIDVTLYFSETSGKTLPRFIKDFIVYHRYVQTLLEQYAVASDGKVKVAFVDPVTDSDEAQDALDFGLDGKPINQHGDLFFFGLVFQTQTGSRDVVEFLWPNQQETLEYEISRRLHDLIWPRSQRIGVLSGLEVLGTAANPYMAQILAAQGKKPGEPWIAMQLLRESYQVEKIPADVDRIDPEQFDLVMVVHPKNLGRRARWALDEWIQRGGATMVFVDPYSIDDQPPQNPQNPMAAYQYEPSSNLELLGAWGLERPPGEVAADFDLAIKRPVARGGAAERVVVDLHIDEQAKAATLANHPVTRGLADLRFFTAGALRQTNGGVEGVTYEPLVTTTASGGTLEMQAGFPSGEGLTFLDLGDPAKLADRLEPGAEPVVLAYLLQGKLPTAYPEGADVPSEPPPPPPPGLPPGLEMPLPEDAETVHKEPVPEDERAEATVMVFADVDFISDQLAFQNSIFGVVAANDNHKVLENAVDYLFGSRELMKVRSKQSIRRPFELFDEIEARADEDSLERERELRADIARFEEELREKQSAASGNEALFQKKLQEEIEQLNDRIQTANRELREIRKEKRAALASEESKVRFAAMGLMPIVVLALGLGLFVRRRRRDLTARKTP